MISDIQKIGELLKTKREELNLSLKEIENTTSIRSSYLEAIEEGQSKQYLNDVYMQGFLRQYASFLGFDAVDMEKEYPHVFQVKNEDHHFEFGIGTLEARGSMGGGVKWLPNLVWGGITAGLIVLVWLFAKYMGVF